jgi:hypothetical protein
MFQADPIRIYRPLTRQEHDLSFALDSWVDVYGCDKRGVITTDDGAMAEFDLGARTGQLTVTAQLRVSSKLDVGEGYYVQSKKSLLRWGTRGAVATELAAQAAAGATSLVVEDGTGFAAGDTFLVRTTGSYQMGRIHLVEGDTLTLWADGALRATYPAGSEVCVCRFWKVTGRLTPVETGPVKRLLLTETTGAGGLY